MENQVRYTGTPASRTHLYRHENCLWCVTDPANSSHPLHAIRTWAARVLPALTLLALPAFAQAPDTVNPVFVSASTDGALVTIAFSEEIFISPLVRYVKEWSGAPLQLFLRAAFDVSINGRVIYTQEFASLSGTNLTLRMAYYAGPGDEVRVAYNNIFVRNARGLLVDAAGNAVPYFSYQTVQNNAGSPGSNLADGAVLTPGEITIREGETGTYTVALPSQPSENVTVKVMPYAIVQVTPTQLTFTPDNWDEPQTVTVLTNDDNDSVDAWAAVLHQIVGDSSANWTFVKIVVDDQDPPLVVSGSTSIGYTENGTSPVATYSVADAGGTTVTWRLLGDDKNDFTISRGGVLAFKTPPDHENPADSNGDNVYQVTIHASNGTATGALLDVPIRITNVVPPSAPGAPTVSPTSGVPDSLDVSWTEPENVAKPDIDSYDLRYRKGTSGGWNNGPQNQTETSATIEGLDEDTSYEVQVRATNDEGDSPWSDAGTGQTYAPPTVSTIAIASKPGADRTYAEGDEIRVTVIFSETVQVTGTPQLSLELGGGRRTATYGGGSGTAALVFTYEVADGESDTDGVGVEADSLTGGTIRDAADNDAVLDHDGVAADSGHKVDGVRPELAATGGAVVNGTTLTLTYDEPLGGSSTPETGDFTVSGGDQTRTITRISLSGSTVLMTLDPGGEHLEAGIRVSYTPGTNPIRDVPGNQAEALSQEPVTNETPDTTAPEVSSLAISSNPGSDRTYAAGDEIEVTVTFSETVEVERTPQLRLRVGTRTRTAGYLRGSGTAALVFGYEVADGDEDSDGVSIEAGRIALNGGMIEDEAENAAELTHEALATQAGHWVDGVRPVLLSAAVEGASLTLTYGVALDGGSRPASGNFTVEVEGSGPERFGSLDQGQRGDAVPEPGGRARRYGDPCELHGSDGGGGEPRSGMRWATRLGS